MFSKRSKCVFYVTTYTDNDVLAHVPKGDLGKGIYVWELDTDKGLLSNTYLSNTQIDCNPAFLVKNPNKNILYCSTERIDQDGEIIEFKIEKDYQLKQNSSISSKGKSTCYLTPVISEKDSNECLVSVNYWDSSINVFNLNPDTGYLYQNLNSSYYTPGSQYVNDNNPDKYEHWQFRQRWPHTHCFVTEPYQNKYHFVADLGRDMILCFTIKDNVLKLVNETKLKQGSGPRHIVFHPNKRLLYVINELDSTVTTLSLNYKLSDIDDTKNKSQTLQEINSISTLPHNFECRDHHTSHASEIRIHPDKKFLFILNRGHDSIAVFKIECNGQLSLLNITPSGGSFPRNFNFDNTGRFLIVGNQNSNNLTIFRIDLDTGVLKKTDQKYQPSPNYVYTLL